MRIVVDIDGTLTRIKYPTEGYADLPGHRELVEWVRARKREGHTIIIYTSRRMKTHGGNVAKVLADSGEELIAWLKREGIPYDEIYLGKPHGDIIFDDLAVALNPELPIDRQLERILPVFVIAAAGEGRRFRDAGFTAEKFEIEARGHTLMYWALKSLPLDMAQRIVVVGQSAKREPLERAVRAALRDLGHSDAFVAPRLAFAWVERTTRGQAETVLHAKPALGALWERAPGVVYNVDTYFESSRLKQRLMGFWHSGDAGLMGLFESRDPKMSFARIEHHRVVETAEKKVISSFASTGLYAFRSLALLEEALIAAGDQVIAEFRELYIAPLYNHVLKNHGTVGYDLAETVHPIGTPDELAAFTGAALRG